MKKYNVPKVKESTSIQILTSIWIVPLLAMIIALWLAYQYYSTIGPTIKIYFKSNAGLVANQSQIKLRDVTIGQVTKISLSNDGTGVIVQAQMNKEVAPYLNSRAKLWIVHPDVDSNGVSGLDTLISGSYIKLHGIKKKETQHTFIGLEEPYIDREAQGRYYLLSAPKSYNITNGSNVYYRMIKVGRVERVGLSSDGLKVDFTIFIEDSCTPFINNRSQFYTRSNFSIDVSQAKLDMSISSLSQIVHGGISIYTPIQTIKAKENDRIAQTKVFYLYKNLSEMKSKHLKLNQENKVYKFLFKEDVRKLEIGSSVEFNGFQVGYVTEIRSHFSTPKKRVDSEVFALISTQAFKDGNLSKEGTIALASLVKNGLKAQLNTTLPIIGSSFIELIFDKDKRASIQNINGCNVFPTIRKKGNSSIMGDIKRILRKLENLPIEKLLDSASSLLDKNNKPINNLIKNLTKTVKNFNRTIDNLNKFTASPSMQQLPNEITTTLQELNLTLMELQSLSQGYGAESQFSAELTATLKELALAAESIERVSRKLEKKPNSLLLGDD